MESLVCKPALGQGYPSVSPSLLVQVQQVICLWTGVHPARGRSSQQEWPGSSTCPRPGHSCTPPPWTMAHGYQVQICPALPACLPACLPVCATWHSITDKVFSE